MFFFGGELLSDMVSWGIYAWKNAVLHFLKEHGYSWVFRCKVDGTHIVEAPGVTK